MKIPTSSDKTVAMSSSTLVSSTAAQSLQFIPSLPPRCQAGWFVNPWKMKTKSSLLKVGKMSESDVIDEIGEIMNKVKQFQSTHHNIINWQWSYRITGFSKHLKQSGAHTHSRRFAKRKYTKWLRERAGRANSWKKKGCYLYNFDHTLWMHLCFWGLIGFGLRKESFDNQMMLSLRYDTDHVGGGESEGQRWLKSITVKECY